MKKQLLLVVMAVLCLLPQGMQAQTQPDPTLTQNLKKYWENRDRFRKFFVKIGDEQGNSIPCAKRSRWDNSHLMRWGDATTQLGWYIGVLATEYKLLKDDGLPTQGTLNELYYAISAFNRLDLTGEVHYADKLKGEITSENLNGWFIRDDVYKTFYQNWDDMGMYISFSDFHNPDEPVGKEFAANSDPSQDQIIALFFGFSFVKKYVDNIYVDPLGNNTGFNIVSECQDITRRIMARFQEFKPFKENEFINYDSAIIRPIVTKRNYCFGNPVYDWETSGGNDKFAFFMAYPIVRLAQTVTGDNSFEQGYKFQFLGNDFNFIVTIPFSELESMYKNKGWDNDFYFELNYADIIMAIVATTGLENLQIEQLGGLTVGELTNTVLVTAALQQLFLTMEGLDFRYYRTDNNSKMALRMALNAAAQSNIHNIGELSDKCANVLTLPIYPMIAKIYNGLTITTGDRDNWWGILNEMSECNGAYMYTENEEQGNPLTGHGGGFWSYDNRWLKHTTSFHEFKTSERYVQAGNNSGLDYMIMYNLFHIQFKQSLNLPTYSKEIICPCKSTKIPEISNPLNNSAWNEYTEIVLANISTLNSLHQVRKYKNDYTNIGINLERYMMQDLTVTGTGILDIREDIKVCNNAKIDIAKWPAPQNNQGRIIVGNSVDNRNITFRFTRGTIFEIKDGGILEIQNNSTVIIEEGATLKIYPNSTIILNGENAVLEIRGKLDILAGATFQTTGTGHVLFNIQNADPSIAPFNIAGTSTSQIVFESTANPKPLKFIVAASTHIYPQQSLQMFKIDGVKGIIGQNAEIFLGSEFQIQNSLIENSGGNGFTFTTLNFTPIIHHNEFVGGNRALTFIGKDNGRDVKIRYNTFQSVLNTIVMYDHSAHIAGNSFIDNCGGVFAGATLNYLVPPTQGGLYKGRLRMELNRFENSSALELHGAYYPSIIYGGNVAHYTPTGSNPTRTDWTIATEKAHSTLKCNWFENQGEAVYHGMSGNLNMSTQRQSYYALGSGGAYVTGGNNFFKNNLRSVVINSQNSRDPFSFATYDINQGQNSFTAIPSNSRTSLIVDRRWNIQSMNYTLNSSGNMEINGNFWTPLLSTSNYSAGFPSDVIEKNYSISNHFNIYEFQSPDFVVGTNTTASTTCPISVWGDAISDPANFNPLSGVAFGFNYGSAEPVKVYFDRPFGLSGEGFDYPPTTVTSGTYTGQGFGSAFHNALTGTTVQTTDENNNTYYVPNPTGLLNMANLLISTANHSTTDEVEIYSFGYKTYLQCLSRAAALDVFEGSTPAEDAQISAALAVFNAIESNNQQFEVSMPERYYQTRFSVGIDKLHLYRLFDRYTDAQNVLAGLASFAQTKEMVTVDYLSCHVENERKLFANEISWVEYRNNLNNCGMLYGSETLISSTDTIGWGDTSQTSGGSSPTPSLVYTIAPNPATAQTSVIIDMNIDATVTVTVFNKFGQQVVATQSLGTLLTGSQTTATVTLSGLPADTYNMVVYADGVPYVQHFIKLTE